MQGEARQPVPAGRRRMHGRGQQAGSAVGVRQHGIHQAFADAYSLLVG
jgi:hypothetical protein